LINLTNNFWGRTQARRKFVVNVDNCTRANPSRGGDAKLPVLNKDSGAAKETMLRLVRHVP
jgi:hypothetical protein